MSERVRTVADDMLDGGLLSNVYSCVVGDAYVFVDGPYNANTVVVTSHSGRTGPFDETMIPVFLFNGGSSYRNLGLLLRDRRASHDEALGLLERLDNACGVLTGARLDALDRVRSYVERTNPHPLAERDRPGAGGFDNDSG